MTIANHMLDRVSRSGTLTGRWTLSMGPSNDVLLKKNAMEMEIDRDGAARCIAEVLDLPGVVVYGQSGQEAISKVETLALRRIPDWLDHDGSIPEFPTPS